MYMCKMCTGTKNEACTRATSITPTAPFTVPTEAHAFHRRVILNPKP